MPKKTARRKAREAAFLILFAESFSAPEEQTAGTEEDKALFALCEEVLDAQPDDFTKTLVAGVTRQQTALDEIIAPCLSKNWKKERIARVPLILLRLSVYEMRFMAETPTQIVINEAVELCKAYAGPKESGFLNGVLGTLARETAPEPDGKKAAEQAGTTEEKPADAQTEKKES